MKSRLEKLPPRLIVAIAARCGRRVERIATRFVETHPTGLAHMGAIERALQAAEGYAAGDSFTNSMDYASASAGATQVARMAFDATQARGGLAASAASAADAAPQPPTPPPSQLPTPPPPSQYATPPLQPSPPPPLSGPPTTTRSRMAQLRSPPIWN